MMLIRPVSMDDLDALFDLANQAQFGLTTLPKDREYLRKRIRASQRGFERVDDDDPRGESYLFVLEDLEQRRVIGTSGILSKVGGFEPFYMYEIKTERKVSKDEDMNVNVDVRIPYLSLVKQHDGPTEIGSLYLSPEYWGLGLGRLLSLCRFLFLAEYPGRFESEVIAEMRGVINGQGESPLWNAIGQHFFQQSFPQAESLTVKSKKFIAELMPEIPIYIPLLPTEAQQVIGEVHENTKPALAMLQKEGFEYRNFVDIFDGGPAIHCESNRIRSVAESRKVKVGEIASRVESETRLISNCRLDFRTTRGPVEITDQGNTPCATIDQVTALLLGLRVGDDMRFVAAK